MNKVYLGNEHISKANMVVANIIDGATLSYDTVASETLVEGYTAHDKNGNPITGIAESAIALEENVVLQDDLIAQIKTALDGKIGVSASGEISITENGSYDVAQYAFANVDVASSPELLWTNASPTSNFAAQTVSLATGYSGYLVEARPATNMDTRQITFLPLFQYNSSTGEGVKAVGTFFNNGKNYAYARVVLSADNGSIQFGGSFSEGATSASVDYLAIPTRIWGVKFTL